MAPRTRGVISRLTTQYVRPYYNADAQALASRQAPRRGPQGHVRAWLSRRRRSRHRVRSRRSTGVVHEPLPVQEAVAGEVLDWYFDLLREIVQTTVGR